MQTKKNIKQINNVSLRSIILLILVMSFVLVPIATPTSASETTNLRKDVVTGDEKFDRIFREGRDLIDKEEWAKAAAKFNEIVCDCPENKYVDAALYWLAFCYKKQKLYPETSATLDRLLKNFPNSSWADDARVMMYETQASRERYLVKTSTGTTGPGQSSAGNLYLASTANYDLARSYAGSQQTPLDREDEIKLAAFQSLLVADQKRGIEVMGDILKSDSRASETLKREVLRSLRSSRSLRFFSYANLATSEVLMAGANNNQFMPLLRETLVKSYQNNSNVKIRTEIIYALANINDDQSFNYIVQLYASENDKEIKKAIINSFGGSSYTLFSSLSGTSPVNKIQAETIAATNSNSHSMGKIRFEKLMEIVRTEKDIELKRVAFSNLQRFVGWSGKEGMIDAFSQMYDAETDEEFKISIIHSFVGIKQSQATAKLLDIAKNEKSNKLRLEAIYSLRGSNNPEVLKFLEDLIK